MHANVSSLVLACWDYTGTGLLGSRGLLFVLLTIVVGLLLLATLGIRGGSGAVVMEDVLEHIDWPVHNLAHCIAQLELLFLEEGNVQILARVSSLQITN